MNETTAQWYPISTAPKNTIEMFVVIAFDVKVVKSFKYTSDPYCVYIDTNGEFIRWPHSYLPTHWTPLPKLKG